MTIAEIVEANRRALSAAAAQRDRQYAQIIARAVVNARVRYQEEASDEISAKLRQRFGYGL